MKRIGLLLIVLMSTLILSLTVRTYAQEAPAYPKNVILIGWDGAQRWHIKECMEKGELPNLQALANEGNLVAIDILRTTDTKAGWSQILTGYVPEITGVFSNSRYQSIPQGYSVFERLESFFGPENFVTAAVIGKKGNMEATPGEPYYYAAKAMDFFINNLGENRNVGNTALGLVEKYRSKPFFIFIHFADVDSNGHKSGEDSQAYTKALISSDLWTGKIIQKLRDLGLYEQTLIYVTADHGFDEGMKTHSDAPYVFLGTNDPTVMRRGERADIAPTLLERFGIDLETVQPPLSGHPLSKPYDPSIW